MGVTLGAARFETLAATLLIAGSDPCPGGEVAIGGEAAHIDANLTQNGGGNGTANAWDMQQDAQLVLVGQQVLLNLPLELDDLLLQRGQEAEQVA